MRRLSYGVSLIILVIPISKRCYQMDVL
uniref:Uncharacterized protein n=1 Tax=Arundo donax TaxID=35708 RepID=A0A0A8ZMF8_ARUDO